MDEKFKSTRGLMFIPDSCVSEVAAQEGIINSCKSR
jgi:hypothetical protein